jgi:hypothetical protein
MQPGLIKTDNNNRMKTLTMITISGAQPTLIVNQVTKPNFILPYLTATNK